MPSLLQSLLLSLVPGGKRESLRKDRLMIEEDWVKDHLGKLDTDISIGPDEMCP